MRRNILITGLVLALLVLAALGLVFDAGRRLRLVAA
jgi:hypothetical protein